MTREVGDGHVGMLDRVSSAASAMLRCERFRQFRRRGSCLLHPATMIISPWCDAPTPGASCVTIRDCRGDGACR